jgi:hypothetical protein
MDENLQEDWLDARLRDEAAYVDDGGFTARVVQKLPSRPVRHVLRAVILLGVTLVASTIAYLLSDGGWFIAEEVTRLSRLPVLVIWICAAIATGLIMIGGLAAAMFRTSGRLR